MLGARVKEAGKKVFAAFGLEIRKRRPAGVEPGSPPERASMTGALRQLVGLGLRPKTVIDVGVAYGTTELYEAVPEAQFLLIEPVAEFEPFLRRTCEKYKAQHVLAAAARQAATATCKERVLTGLFHQKCSLLKAGVVIYARPFRPESPRYQIHQVHRDLCFATSAL